MKYLPFLTFLIVLSTTAQTNLTGTVNSTNKTGIPYATVVTFKMPDSVFHKATSANEKGVFNFNNFEQGTYTFQFSSVGYVPLSRKLNITTNESLGEFILEEDTAQLDAVVLTAAKPTIDRKADRLIFNVENSSLSTGNASEILKSTPGVFEMNGSYMVKGSVAQVYINNKRVILSNEELEQLLRGYNGDNVKSVEVIFNPPARYDADGGAVINIVTSKNVSLGYKGSVKSNWRVDTFAKYQFGTGHSYKNDWINVYANYNYNPRKDLTLQESEVGFFNNDGSRNSRWFTDVRSTSRTDAHALNSIVDITLNKNNSLSFMGYLGVNNGGEVDSDVTTLILPQGATTFSGFNTTSRTKQDYSNGHMNLSWNSILNDSGSSLNIEGTYIFTDTENSQNLSSVFFDNSQTTTGTNSFGTNGFQKANILTAKMDYEGTFGSYNFSSGLKFTDISNKSNQDFLDTNMGSIENPSLSDKYLYDERIYAAYAQVSRDWTKWSFITGLRLEQTDVKGNSESLGLVNNQKYLGVFPNLSVNHILNDENDLTLSYRRSIDRPGSGDLNPFNNFTNDNIVSTGTPGLVPAFTDKINLGWNYKNELFVDIYYINTNDMINSVSFQNNETNTLFLQSVNLNYEFQYSVDATFYKFLNESWLTSTTFGAFYMENEVNALQSPIRTQQTNTTGYFVDTNNFFDLSKDSSLKMTLSATYVSSILFGTYRYENLFTSRIGFSKSLWNNRAILTASYNDIFLSANQPFISTYQNQDNTDFTILETQLFSLGFTYKFGNYRLENRDIETPDDQERTGKKTKGF